LNKVQQNTVQRQTNNAKQRKA